MRNQICSRLKLSHFSALVLAAVVSAAPVMAQVGPSVHVGGTNITGFPQDWSHRHVVYSNPGTEAQAIQRGDYDHWQKIVNSPRYVLQQLKSNHKVEGPAAVDAEYRSRWDHSGDYHPDNRGKTSQSDLTRDWSESLGGATANGLADGQYPAKYNYTTTTASCTDYVVFPTGATSSATQATIVAFNSLYSGCPLFSGGKPVVDWAYNTGGTTYKATTSPVISLDGTQIAFVQSNGTTAQLVLLKVPVSGTGTVTAPTALTTQSSATNYRNCTAPCDYTISLGANDTTSAPFPVFYNSNGSAIADLLYVGDAVGKVHQVSGAFYGTPTLDSPSGAGGWPVTASSETKPALSAPVYDSGGSGRIFVTDASGYLHSFTANITTGATGTVSVSNQLETSTAGIFDAPLVDPSTEEVYLFVAYSSSTNDPSHIVQFAAGTSISASSGTVVSLANNGTTNPATSYVHAGTFDNQYYNGTGTSGHLYVCEDGKLFQVTMGTGAFNTFTVRTYDTLVSTVGVAAACSPVTEFLGIGQAANTTMSTTMTTTTTFITVASTTGIATGTYIQIDSEIMDVTGVFGGTTIEISRGADGTTAATHASGAAVHDVKDGLFVSVKSLGNEASCAGACVYNYNVIAAATTGNPTDSLASTGGTSGIVIDSSSTAITGDEEIYYTQLGSTNAIQASQAGLQ